MKVISTKEAAAALGIAHPTVSKALRSGRLNGFRLGHDWAVCVDAKFRAFEARPPYRPRKSGPRCPKCDRPLRRILERGKPVYQCRRCRTITPLSSYGGRYYDHGGKQVDVTQWRED